MAVGLLAEAIGKLDEPDGVPATELVEVFALRDRPRRLAVDRGGAFDRDELYALDGATSTTGWLKDRCRMTGADAARVASTAKRLRDLPHTGQAWRDGALASGHVRAICANVADRHADKFAKIEEAMVGAFEALPVTDAVAVMRAWKAAADDADPAATSASTLTTSSVSPRSSAKRPRALLLGRPHVTVLVREDDDGEPVGRTLAGKAVSRTKLRQWFCDAMVGPMMTARSRILDYGTDVPTVPVALWQAVAARDQGCRCGSCDRGPGCCEAHHVIPVSQGGATSIENLVMCCSNHHHTLHKPGWTAPTSNPTAPPTSPPPTAPPTHPASETPSGHPANKTPTSDPRVLVPSARELMTMG
jgi:hypothetical protein